MKQSTAPTLSAHLLREASKFHMYPLRVYRTRSNLEAQKAHDKILERLVEWRETFAPSPQNEFITFLTNPAFLDEFYCRDLLKTVPDIVERTAKLSHLTLSGISDSEFVYLREAAKYYIFGLQQAAVALARAALEDCLRKKLATLFGKKAVGEQKLEYLIEDLAPRAKALSRDGRTRAHEVQRAANQVLHGQNAGSPGALSVIEAARAVIMELSHR